MSGSPRPRSIRPSILRFSAVAAIVGATFVGAPAAHAVGGTISSVALNDADSDQPISGYSPLLSPATIDLAALPTRRLNLQAFTSPATVGSVVFVLDGVRRVESGAPYEYAGEGSFTPAVGNHILTVTAFSGAGGTGTASPVRTYNFSVVDDGSGGTTPPPVVTPPATKLWPTSWTTGAASPVGRFESTSLLVGSKVYVFGGFRDKDYRVHRSYASFDIPNNRWASLGNLPAGMAETHLAAATDGRYVYLAGGLGGDYRQNRDDAQVTSNRVYRFDTTNNAWSQIATLPAVRAAGGLALIANKLHYIGGIGANNITDFRDHYVYDLGTKHWSTAAAMPEAKDHFSTAVFGGRIYALQGEFGHHLYHQQKVSVHAYDPLTNTWQARANAPLAKSHDESATFISDGRIIMAGGQIDGYHATDQVAAYNPVTNSWSTLQRLPAVRQGVVVQRYGNRLVITTGGVATNAPLANTWLGAL